MKRCFLNEHGLLNATRIGTDAGNNFIARDNDEKQVKCPVCGKMFWASSCTVYRDKKKWNPICSWSCMLEYEKRILRDKNGGKAAEIPERCKNCAYLNVAGKCAVYKLKFKKEKCGYFLER